MIIARNLTYNIGEHDILSNVSLIVNDGEKVGLVGVNGAGKSTLIKIIVGEITPNSGESSVSGQIGYVSQAVTLYGADDEKTIFEYMSVGRGLDILSRKMEELSVMMSNSPEDIDQILAEYSDVTSQFEAKGGWEAEATISKYLTGLGVGYLELSRKMKELSGGQKTRIAIARVLYTNPDNLIMDEPTNHLDVEAKLWLMNYLTGYKGALLIVSHDLEMLNRAINKVLRLNEFTHQIDVFHGNYDDYLAQKKATDERIMRTLKVQRAEIARLEKTAHSILGAGANRASQGKVILRRVERMREQLPEEPRESRAISIRFPISRPSGGMVIKVNGLSKWYGENEVVKPIQFTIPRSERWAVIGVNGAGKSTLLKMIVGLVEPTSGDIILGHAVDIGYYAQEHEELDPNKTLLEEVKQVSSLGDGYLRTALGHFLLSGNKVFEKVKVLSGGERSRLALCKLVLQGHNFLLLDEPTNNLDPLSTTKLLEALDDYEGTMLVVSHNLEYLLALKPSMAILMPESKVVPFDEKVYDRVGKWE